jgi:hypothetical protein
MMTARTDLEAPLRALVDDRLDAIERVLLRAGVSRGERRSIVEAVENQIHEMLARRTTGEPTRDDVLAVLASLDPPEQYAPEEYRQRPAPARRPRVPQLCPLAIGSAAGAVLTLFAAYLAASLEGESAVLGAFFLALAAAGVTACGILSIVRIRRSGGWLFGLPAALFAAVFYPLLLVNGVLFIGMEMLELLGLVVVTALTFLAINAYVVYRLWLWVSADYRRATPAAHP